MDPVHDLRGSAFANPNRRIHAMSAAVGAHDEDVISAVAEVLKQGGGRNYSRIENTGSHNTRLDRRADFADALGSGEIEAHRRGGAARIEARNNRGDPRRKSDAGVDAGGDGGRHSG